MTKLDANEITATKVNETILEKAERIVMGDREEEYGHPAENHECTADMWNAYLRRKKMATPLGGFHIDSEDVCILNILQKISRYANNRGKDTLVDIAGWARCIERIGEYGDINANEWEDETPHAFAADILSTDDRKGLDRRCSRCERPLSHSIHRIGKSA